MATSRRCSTNNPGQAFKLQTSARSSSGAPKLFLGCAVAWRIENGNFADLKTVTIYTDGACSGNPGRGGYGVVLIYGTQRKELAGGFRLTTNNRMEIIAAITGLRSLKEQCAVRLHTDSRYVVDSITKGWAKRWRVKAWKIPGGGVRPNADLWQQLLDECTRHTVEFVWVRGHASNVENNRCDELAVQAARGKDLPVDAGYGSDAVSAAPAPLLI